MSLNLSLQFTMYSKSRALGAFVVEICSTVTHKQQPSLGFALKLFHDLKSDLLFLRHAFIPSRHIPIFRRLVIRILLYFPVLIGVVNARSIRRRPISAYRTSLCGFNRSLLHPVKILKSFFTLPWWLPPYG